VNYYFLPRMANLNASVTLANFPPAGVGAMMRRRHAYVLWSDGARWCTQMLATLEPSQTLIVHDRDLVSNCPPEDEASLFLCLAADRLPEMMDELPALPDMETVPAWRANIRLASAFTSVSYQGEYPAAMTRIPQATLVSFSPLLQHGPGISNKLVFVNLGRLPERRRVPLIIGSDRSRRPLLSCEVETNRLSVIALDGLGLADDELCIAQSRGITGVPIFLSHDEAFRELSLEHTHPPTEMAVFGDRAKLQSRLKASWLQ
jgi:hypothetical protein